MLFDPANNRRLGIANLRSANARYFVNGNYGEYNNYGVLHLPEGTPIYQQQLVHSQALTCGPANAAAEWCGSEDSNAGDPLTIREISAHDTFYSRRNLSQNNGRRNFLSHKATYSHQIYYVNNEPEAGSLLSSLEACSSYDCWNPRDRVLDQMFSDVFPGSPPDYTFWETAGAAYNDDCDLPGSNSLRIKPNVMAFVFLRLRRQVAGTQHVVLPPSAVNPQLGAKDGYWATFFDKIHHGVTIRGITENPITPEQLKALHLHYYNQDTINQDGSLAVPLKRTAYNATCIRTGVDWYRNAYTPGQPLPLDILLSEMGTRWQLSGGRKYAGGWYNFRDGLLWWNSWLRWLTRRAPYECNLAGWDTGAHALYACIHEPNLNPYVTTIDPNDHVHNSTYNVLFYNTDTWYKECWPNMPIYIPGQLETIQPCSGNTYFNFFTTLDTGVVHSPTETYYRTPFGATYSIWAEICTDAATNDPDSLGSGFVYNTQSGLVGTAHNFRLDPGWNTIYFVVLKTTGQTGGQLHCYIKD